MTDRELEFCMLSGPVADALDMLEAGNLEGAKAVLRRVVQRAQEICDRDQARESGKAPPQEADKNEADTTAF